MPAVSAVGVRSIMRQWCNSVLIPIEPDPLPKATPEPPNCIRWPVQAHRLCPSVVPPVTADFVSVLEGRRSHRDATRAPLREIVNTLGFATRPRFVREDDAYNRTRRPTQSAGALHVVQILIADWRGSPRVMRYNSADHQLEVLRIVRPASMEEFVCKFGDLLSSRPPTALVLVADLGQIQAVYENPISLVWRDAGALLQTLNLVSTAFRMAFCSLGPLGGEVIDAIGLDRRFAFPVGCAAIGRSQAGALTNSDVAK